MANRAPLLLFLLTLLTAFALAGCSADEPVADTPAPADPVGPGTDGQAAAPRPPPLGRFDETFDLQVTSIGVSEGLNMGYDGNCVQVTAGRHLAGNVTLAWTASPNTATLELVAYAWPDGKEFRVSGPSPLVLDFEFLAGDFGSDDTVELSIQAPPRAASVSQAATLHLDITHDADVPPAPNVTSCGF